MNSYSISIVTPIFNEEEIIESTIIKNIEILDSKNINYEIIVVDDASIDNSLVILKRLSKSYPIKIIAHHINLGFGGAIKSGIEAAKKDYILCLPADSPLDNDIYSAFEDNLGKADLLVSYRIKRLGYTWWMSLNSYIYHQLISLIFSMKLKDYNWIHLYRREIFQENKINIEYNSIFMLAEVLIKARNNSNTFIEFPVNQIQRVTGEASAAKLKTIINTLKDLILFYPKNRSSKKL
ncbi:MAG TPA: glycosyltransferase family 2 protein [Chitinophagales bacterium]|nr:glycosyltransferase family 2 protein [Chitinophagales bacterium]